MIPRKMEAENIRALVERGKAMADRLNSVTPGGELAATMRDLAIMLGSVQRTAEELERMNESYKKIIHEVNKNQPDLFRNTFTDASTGTLLR